MSTRIYKYALAITAGVQFLPVGGRFYPLHVGLDPGGDPTLWGLTDTEAPPPNHESGMTRVFVVGTGDEAPPAEGPYAPTYVGTFVDGSFVWHVFILPSKNAIAEETKAKAEREAEMQAMLARIRGDGPDGASDLSDDPDLLAPNASANHPAEA